MRGRAEHGFGIAVLLLFVVAAGCSSSGGDMLDRGALTVGDSNSDDFASIQAAVDAATPGATVDVAAGTYLERVVISKSITLRGAGGASILQLPAGANPSDPPFEIRNAVNVRLEGFTVRGPADGIVVRDSSDVIIASVVASGNGDEGVDVRHSSGVEISGNFDDNLDNGIQVRDGSDGVLVHSSVVSGNIDDGVQIEDSTGITVTSITASENGQDGVKVERSTGCTVSDNEITINGDDGVIIGDSSGTQVLRNVITDNGGYGIRIYGSPTTVLEDNTVSGSGAGDIQID